MCIEALTYEKLKSFSRIVPESVIATWQPPQAVKALLEFEPQADQSFSIAFAAEKTPGERPPDAEFKHLGTHKSLNLRWLRKHYNKLGSLLHAPNPASSPKKSDLEATYTYLNEVVADLAEPLSSTITGGFFRHTVSFNCIACKRTVVANESVIKSSKIATCLSSSCGAQHLLTKNTDGTIGATLICTEFECIKCNALNSIENRKLEIGANFNCIDCKTKHYIATREWGYQCES
jgi:transcription elongation factor Elf1